MDLTTMSVEELVELQAKISKEIEAKRDVDFQKAIHNLKNAYFDIKNNFPWATWKIEVYDANNFCNYEVDLLEIGDSLFDNIYR